MVAHIGTRRRPRDGQGGPERDSSAVILARAKGLAGASGVKRTDGERLGLALLPGQALGRDDVERDIDDMERPPLGGLARGTGAVRLIRPQLVDARIVLEIEAGEGVRIAPRPR